MFKCDICNKKYKHQPSLSRHNRKFHTKNQLLSTFDKLKSTNNQPCVFKYHCKYCNKGYNINQSKWKHEKTCKNKINLEIENNELKKEIIDNKKEIMEIKNDLMKLMNKNCKMHPKTLQKINKQLLLNNNTNNGTINNITNIIQFGKEDVINNLTKKEQLSILNQKFQSINYLIEYIHFNNKFPQFKNIAITNLKDNLAYMFNKNKNKFIAVNKNELLNNVIETRMLDIEDIYANNKNNLKSQSKETLERFIKKINHDDAYYEFKKADLKLLLYNNRDNITV